MPFVSYRSDLKLSTTTITHSSMGLTPFEITFVRKPPAIPEYIGGASQVEAVDEMLSQRDTVLKLLRRKLLKAQEKMKQATNAHRRPQEFNIGDWVLVKLRPHRQITASETTHSKLAKKYYGPFKVAERLGKVAYRLKLPVHSHIHPVFHVSLLKPFVGKPEAVSTDPLPAAFNDETIATPLAIVDSKLIPSKVGPKRMVLVQWEGLPLEDASWEDWQQLKELHNLEDKVLSEERGDVMNVEDKV